jgi:uncharacterized protein YukJ
MIIAELFLDSANGKSCTGGDNGSWLTGHVIFDRAEGWCLSTVPLFKKTALA